MTGISLYCSMDWEQLPPMDAFERGSEPHRSNPPPAFSSLEGPRRTLKSSKKYHICAQPATF
jgi:hypothetical protein